MEDNLEELALEHLWRFEKRLPMYCPTPYLSNLTPGTSTKRTPESPF
jgi:hypothetical protein